MSTQKVLFIIFILIILGMGSIFVSTKNSPQTSTVTENVAQQSETNVPLQDQRYVSYSQAAFDTASGKKRVLYFHAPWCPTCVPTDKEFTANLDRIPADVVLFKTDYDTSGELKKKYGVTYQHTFVLVDQNGGEVTKWNGGAIAELIENTK